MAILGRPPQEMMQHAPPEQRRLDRRRRRGWPIAAILVLFLWPFLSAPVAGQQPEVTEYELKAAYLYNFAKFTEWPGNRFRSGKDPIVIGVTDTDAFLETLKKTVAGKLVNGRPFLVTRWKPEKPAAACHILFVAEEQSRQLPEILRLIEGASVLLVGESPEFARQGGIINFVLAGDKVRFEINIDAAEHHGLKMSSQLLSLAIIVTNKNGGPTESKSRLRARVKSRPDALDGCG